MLFPSVWIQHLRRFSPPKIMPSPRETMGHLRTKRFFIGRNCSHMFPIALLNRVCDWKAPRPIGTHYFIRFQYARTCFVCFPARAAYLRSHCAFNWLKYASVVATFSTRIRLFGRTETFLLKSCRIAFLVCGYHARMMTDVLGRYLKNISSGASAHTASPQQ